MTYSTLRNAAGFMHHCSVGVLHKNEHFFQLFPPNASTGFYFVLTFRRHGAIATLYPTYDHIFIRLRKCSLNINAKITCGKDIETGACVQIELQTQLSMTAGIDNQIFMIIFENLNQRIKPLAQKSKIWNDFKLRQP